MIIAAADDLHARCVAQVIRNDYHKECLIWDVARLPADDRAIIELGHDGRRCSLIADGRQHDLDQVTSVWWRRPQSPCISPEVTQPWVREFCQGETDRFVNGLTTLTSATFINEPDAQARANRKAVVPPEPARARRRDHPGECTGQRGASVMEGGGTLTDGN